MPDNESTEEPQEVRKRPAILTRGWWSKKKIAVGSSVLVFALAAVGGGAVYVAAMQDMQHASASAVSQSSSKQQSEKPQPHGGKADGSDSGSPGGTDNPSNANGKDGSAQSASGGGGSSAEVNNVPTTAGGGGGNTDSAPVASNGSNGSGSSGGSDDPTPPSGGGGSSPTPSPAPSDPHAGKTWHDAEYTEKWVPNVVTVTDSPAWDEQVESGEQIVCSDGSIFTSMDKADNYMYQQTLLGNRLSYSVQPTYSTVHHPAVTHTEDRGHYEDVLVKEAGWY